MDIGSNAWDSRGRGSFEKSKSLGISNKKRGFNSGGFKFEEQKQGSQLRQKP